VDANGIGYNIALNLRDEKFQVEFVHVGLRVQTRPGPDDPRLRSFNLRAKYYQRLVDLIQRKALDGLRDATTIGQLAGIRYELDASGRIKIESKDSARQRGVRSPDRADALTLALGNHRPEFTMKDLRIVPRRTDREAEAYYLGGRSSPRMREFFEPKTAAVVGGAEFIGWMAAHAQRTRKAPRPWTSDWKLGSLRVAVRMPEDGVSTARYRVFEKSSSKHEGC
jgi:hypothetical protein